MCSAEYMHVSDLRSGFVTFGSWEKLVLFFFFFCLQDPCHFQRNCTASTGCFANPIPCNDNDACTTDTCSLLSGCQFNLTVICNDGNACTSDRCNNGVCEYRARTCTGSDPCYTNNLCDSNTGSCITNVPLDPSLYNSSNNACFTTTCPIGNGGPLVTQTNCSDSNECTIDSCVNSTGCVYENRTCFDGNFCTLDECISNLPGGCRFTDNSSACNDNNLCTQDLCNATSGCFFPSNSSNCNLGDVCKIYTCDPAAGCEERDRVCDDGDFCKIWTCTSLSGIGCQVRGLFFFFFFFVFDFFFFFFLFFSPLSSLALLATIPTLALMIVAFLVPGDTPVPTCSILQSAPLVAIFLATCPRTLAKTSFVSIHRRLSTAAILVSQTRRLVISAFCLVNHPQFFFFFFFALKALIQPNP